MLMRNRIYNMDRVEGMKREPLAALAFLAVSL